LVATAKILLSPVYASKTGSDPHESLPTWVPASA